MNDDDIINGIIIGSVNENLTQQQVADILNMERSSIAKYENGTSTPNIKNLPEICEVLSVSVMDLLK